MSVMKVPYGAGIRNFSVAITVTSAIRRATTFAPRTRTVLRSARDPRPAVAMGTSGARSLSGNGGNANARYWAPIPRQIHFRSHDATEAVAERDPGHRSFPHRQLPGRGHQLRSPAGRIRVVHLRGGLPHAHHQTQRTRVHG